MPGIEIRIGTVPYRLFYGLMRARVRHFRFFSDFFFRHLPDIFQLKRDGSEAARQD